MFSLRRLLPVVFVALFSIISWGAGEESPYIIVQEGAEWTMDARLVSAKGEEIPATAHRVIEGEVEKDGKKYLRERTWLEVKGEKVVEYRKLVRKDGTGFYSIQEGLEGATEQREIVLPLKVGQSWEFSSRGKTVKCTVIAVETVKIGEKTYENCFHLQSSVVDGNFTEDFWEAPHEGSIRSDGVYANGSKVLLTIKEFKAGK